ncbi:hypothetical protein B0T09DRAFT_319675 [Sordaria sp. MPI-SDFR-AT-0083]|nr:hypothetical protein B0T09DRAFT_319675 [Sordaria sp. MPI-SDFR-AT-0083]
MAPGKSYASPTRKIWDDRYDKCLDTPRAIWTLVETAERLYDDLEDLRFREDGQTRYNDRLKCYQKIGNELEQVRAAEKKREAGIALGNKAANGPPYVAPTPIIWNDRTDKFVCTPRAISLLVWEAENLYLELEALRFEKDGYQRYKERRKRYDEIWKKLEQLRAAEKAAAEQKKRADEQKRAEQKRRDEENRRAAEKAADQERRRQQILKQKDDQIKALKEEWAAEHQRRAEAEARAKEFLASEEKKRQALVQKADEKLRLLQAELAEKKMQAELFACCERQRAVEEVRKELEDTKKRLNLEYEAFQQRSREAFEAAERQRIEDENLRARARKEKEAALARQSAEKQTSPEQRPKEVSFDSTHNQIYGLSPASHGYRQPEQQNVKRPDSDNQQHNHHPSHDRSQSQKAQHVSDVWTAAYPQYEHHRQADQPKHHYPQYTHPLSHHCNGQRPTTGDFQRDHQAPVGLSGMPAGSSVASYSPALAPWDDYNQHTVGGYEASHGPQWQSHHDPSYLHASTTGKKWSTPQISTWNAPVLDSFGTSRPESPVKEKWSLPPSPIVNPKQVDVRSPRETEEEKLRRELAEEKARNAKLAADLERKKRVSGADSVATWQTGTKSIWEDATKDTSKHAPHAHQSEMPKAQAAKPSFSQRNKQDAKRDNKVTGSSKESSKPTTVSVQNLRRREPSVDRNGFRPSSRTSTHTRYFEAEEHISSDEEHTPRPKFSRANTRYAWRKPSLESIPRYVPPTPHRHPSPPPKLSPTPPRGSTADARQGTQTPKLAGIPGSWRDEHPPADLGWPANVSTPSVKSPPTADHKTTETETYKPGRYVPVPKDVPPPGSYLSANAHHRKSSYQYPVPPYYPGSATTVPQPVAGPSGHGGQFSSWADPTVAQSTDGPRYTREEKGKGKARW